MGRYDFEGATTAMYSFFLYDFCDIYLEATKVRNPSHLNCFCVYFHARSGSVPVGLGRAVLAIRHRLSPRMFVAVPRPVSRPLQPLPITFFYSACADR